MQKISLLTIIYEITGIGVLFIQSMFDSFNVLTSSIVALDVIMSSTILFLMIEHNNDYYVKMIEKLNSWYLCCCCKSLIEDVIHPQEHIDVALSGKIDIKQDEDDELDDEDSLNITIKPRNTSSVMLNEGRTSRTSTVMMSLRYPQIDGSNTEALLGSLMIERARYVEGK